MKTTPIQSEKLKKILYVSPFAFAISGADESLCQILEQAPLLNIEATVIAPLSSQYLEKFTNLGAKTYGFPLLRLKRSRNFFYWLWFFMWQPVEVLFFMFLIVFKKIDLVHLNMESTLSAALSAKILQKPVIIHYRGKTVDSPAWFFNLFLPLVYKLADRVLCISHASAQGFVKRTLTQKMIVLHNSVNLEKFSTPTQKSFFAALSPKPMITFIGRIDPQKRIVDLLHAADLVIQKNPEFAVAIVGGDMNISAEKSHLEELKQLLKTLSPQLTVHFLGSQKDIPSILASSQCLVLPSTNEGFGRVVIEAMAVKTPVIAAASGALPEILNQGELGTLVRPCDPEHLAEAILNVLNRADHIGKKRDLAFTYAQTHYSTQSYAEKLKTIYADLYA